MGSRVGDDKDVKFPSRSINRHATEMLLRIDTRLLCWIEPSVDAQISLVLTDVP